MDKSMINVCRDISNGKFPEENIPQLFNYMTDQYYTYAGIRLAMHYDALSEAYLEEGKTWSRDAAELLAKINELIEGTIMSGSSSGPEKSVHTADKLRNGIMDRMKVLTSYADIFRIYEYVLNRIEYRFKEDGLPSEDDDFARNVLRYIFDSQDNLVINEKIKDIIGQLPVRMAKQKFFDLLTESMRPYTGADLSAFEAYLYILRTSAMLLSEKDMAGMYPELWKNKTFLSDLKYSELTEEEYKAAKAALDKAITFINLEISVYYGLQEIINEVYALLLCRHYSGMAVSRFTQAQKTAFSILRLLTAAVKNPAGKELFSEAADQFVKLEGVQEELADELSVLEDALFAVGQNFGKIVEGIMLEKLRNVLLRTKDLLSSSLFIDWNIQAPGGKADGEYIEKEAKKLINELVPLFTRQDRCVTRAVMANTLNKMPVFFRDRKEVMDYIRSSLEHCNDSYEKKACMEIINNIMTE